MDKPFSQFKFSHVSLRFKVGPTKVSTSNSESIRNL
jgi:hypothetical protein